MRLKLRSQRNRDNSHADYRADPRRCTQRDYSGLSGHSVIGWRGGGEIAYQDDGNGGQTAVEGPARFGLVEVTPGSVPSGHMILGVNYTLNEDNSVAQAFLTEAIPQPEPGEIETLRQEVVDLKARVAVLEGAP
jgi:hypothetical protein